MGESATGAPEALGKHRWERQFKTEGIPKFKYHILITQPYTAGFLGVHPDLTEEQRQVAVKEFLRRYREGLQVFLQSIAMESFNYAKGLVIPVPARSPKPSAGFSPELIV
jgi:hypothetical protein